jgi:hypothetical protein
MAWQTVQAELGPQDRPDNRGGDGPAVLAGKDPVGAGPEHRDRIGLGTR